MKLNRFFATALVAATLSMISVVPAFAVDVVKDDSYVWTETKGEWSCVNASGDAVTGWAVRDDDDIYYLDKKGVMKTGWIKDDGSWYYLDENKGTLATDCWVDNYYVNADGEMTKIK